MFGHEWEKKFSKGAGTFNASKPISRHAIACGYRGRTERYRVAADKHSFPGSAWERIAFEALPRFILGRQCPLADGACNALGSQAEPGNQWVSMSDKCRILSTFRVPLPLFKLRLFQLCLVLVMTCMVADASSRGNDSSSKSFLEVEQDALRQAGDFAQQSVVQIETFGGREVVGRWR